MSPPVVFMDVVFLSAILLASLLLGLLIGWLLFRRRVPSNTNSIGSSDTGFFLQLMSRADHSLDNYITSIQGHLSVLGEDLPSDPERWKISRDAISQAAMQMKRHVERLRLIRMGVNEDNMRIAPVNLARLIEHILIGLEPAATEKQINLRLEVQRLTQPVPGDPQMFEEVFTTLLDNAIKHNPPGTEVVAELLRNNGQAVARISDTGMGMNRDLISQIFEKGIGNRGAGSPSGTGMGLYIAKMLIEIQGGRIEVESQPGKGSIFSVALPLVRPEN